jgi:hypothetical protein
MPLVRLAPLPSALLLTALIAACDGRSAGLDAAPTDATSVGSCDPARQDCPAGQTCDLVCNGPQSRLMCRPVPAGGGIAVGSSCRDTVECALASGCFATVGQGSSCIRYCDSDADCAGKGTCQVRGVFRECGQSTRFTLKFCL